jgi:hypothetical protein
MFEKKVVSDQTCQMSFHYCQAIIDFLSSALGSTLHKAKHFRLECSGWFVQINDTTHFQKLTFVG